VQNLAIYSCFLAKLDNFPKSCRSKVSFIKLFNIILSFQDIQVGFGYTKVQCLGSVRYFKLVNVDVFVD